MSYPFLSERFLEAMNDIGRYGAEKYNDTVTAERKPGRRWSSSGNCAHACTHFGEYLNGVKHDHFNTRKHQLAAVAFNAFMEYMMAGLEDESSDGPVS